MIEPKNGEYWWVKTKINTGSLIKEQFYIGLIEGEDVENYSSPARFVHIHEILIPFNPKIFRFIKKIEEPREQ